MLGIDLIDTQQPRSGNLRDYFKSPTHYISRNLQ